MERAKAEFSKWSFIALPAALTIMFNCSLTLTDASILGHLVSDVAYPNSTSTDFLAAVSLGYSWYYALNIFIMAGFSEAICVLGSQSFGAKNYVRGAQVYCAGLLCSFLICIPIGIGIYYTADVVKLILPTTTTDLRYTLIQDFSRRMLFALPGQTLASCTSNFLNTANVVYIPLYLALFSAIINLGFNLCLVHGSTALNITAYGFRGSPLSTAATNSINGIGLFLYLMIGEGSDEHRYSKIHLRRWCRNTICCCGGSGGSGGGRTTRIQTSPPNLVTNAVTNNAIDIHSERETLQSQQQESCFNRDVFSTYTAQALPLAIGGAFEEWQIQVVGFFAGALGPVSTATNNGMQQIFVTLSALNYGIMTATTIRIGYYLGEGKPENAKSVAIIAFVTSLCCGSSIGVAFILFRNEMGKLFSNDPKVIELSAKLCWIVGPTYILLSVFFVSVATLQGQGRSLALAVCFLIGAWLVSVPAAWIFAFDLKLDLPGIWYGFVAGYGVIMVLTFIAVYRSAWEKISEVAVAENKLLSKDKMVPAVATADEDRNNSMTERLLVGAP